MNRLLATLRWRHLRWAACAAVIPVLWACDARRLAAPKVAPAVIQQKRFAQSVNHKLDILFMIDDSNSMAPLQNKMAMRLPDFMNALKDPTTGVLPDVHVGVVSSSLGAGAWGGVPQCSDGTGGPPGNDDGKFQQGPGGAGSGSCTAAGLHAGEKFLKNFDDSGNPNPNYDNDIATVFSCMALLGDRGCGFESQFESTEIALQKASVPAGSGDGQDADNGGFLRSDAFLAIVLFTNEDDCSVAYNSLLLDPNIQTVADPSGLGGLQSYRCNEFGHLCDGGRLPHNPPASPMAFTTCISAEDNGPTDDKIMDPSGAGDPTHGHLNTVAEFVSFVNGLKDDPNKILVAAIAGPTTNVDGTYAGKYVIDSFNNPAAGGGELEPEVQHSCSQAGTNPPEYGDPAVRIKQWVDSFGANGVFEPICATDYTAAMTTIAATIQKKLGASCVSGQVAFVAGTNPPVPDCQVIERVTDPASGMVTPTNIQSCLTDPNNTCWQLVANDPECTMTDPTALRFQVCIGGSNNCGATPAQSTEERNSDVSCALM